MIHRDDIDPAAVLLSQVETAERFAQAWDAWDRFVGRWEGDDTPAAPEFDAVVKARAAFARALGEATDIWDRDGRPRHV